MSLKKSNTAKPSANRNHSEPQFIAQPKLKSGGSADIQEKEADMVADQVVQPKLNQSGEPAFFQPNPILQRQIQLKKNNEVQKQEEPENEEVQMKEATPKVQAMPNAGDDDDIQKKDESESDDVQMKSEAPQVQTMDIGASGDDEDIQKSENGEEGNGAETIEKDLKTSKGGGSPMDGAVKNEMESGIGNDFSNVRIHTDSKAQEMSDQIGAQAFTNGNDIYFNQGKYNPSSKDGKHLLAHELTHTVQQGASGEKVQRKEEEKSPADRLPFRVAYDSKMDKMSREETAAYCYSRITGISERTMLRYIIAGDLTIFGSWSTKSENGIKDGYFYFEISRGQYDQYKNYVSKGIVDTVELNWMPAPLSENSSESALGGSNLPPIVHKAKAKSEKPADRDSWGAVGVAIGKAAGLRMGMLADAIAEESEDFDIERFDGAESRDSYYKTLEPEERQSITSETDDRFRSKYGLEDDYMIKRSDPKHYKQDWMRIRDEVIMDRLHRQEGMDRITRLIAPQKSGGGDTLKSFNLTFYSHALLRISQLPSMQFDVLEYILVSGSFFKVNKEKIDYFELINIMNLLPEFGPAELMDFSSIVMGSTDQLAIIRMSLEWYIKHNNEKKKEAEELENTKTKLFGLEELYEDYKLYKRRKDVKQSVKTSVGDGMDKKMDRFIIESNPHINSSAMDSQRDDLTKKMKENGFSSIEAFETEIEKYESGFENAAARLAEDHLMRYRRMLFDEEQRLNDDNYVTQLYNELKGSGAKGHYDKADTHSGNVSNMYFPEDRKIPAMVEMRSNETESASDRRKKGKQAIKDDVSSFLVQEDQFEHEDFAQVGSKKAMKKFLKDYIGEKQQSINDTWTDIQDNSEYIYKLDKLYAATRDSQQIEEGSIFDKILTAKNNRIQAGEWFKTITIIILTIALTIVTFGAAAPFAIAAGIASVGLSLYSVYEAVQAYQDQNSANDVGLLTTDPSYVWVFLAIAGAVLDVGALTKVLSAAGKINKATALFNKTGNVAKLENDLAKIGELTSAMRRNVMKSAKIQRQADDFLKTVDDFFGSGARMSLMLGTEKGLAKMIGSAYYMARKGVLSFQNFILELKAAKVIDDFASLTAKEKQLIKDAFNKGKKLADADPKLASEIENAISKGDFRRLEQIVIDPVKNSSSYVYKSRWDALRSAKRDAGIPNSQQPLKIEKVNLTDRYNKPIFDSSGKRITTREYHYIDTKGNRIVIQEHSAGHNFGGIGDQGPHFNVRPLGDERTGSVLGTKDHYNF